VLAELKREIETVLRDTLVDLHREDSEITVVLKNDELLGPVCHVLTRDGRELSLAEFEVRLKTER
jgi:hypothetical protein